MVTRGPNTQEDNKLEIQLAAAVPGQYSIKCRASRFISWDGVAGASDAKIIYARKQHGRTAEIKSFKAPICRVVMWLKAASTIIQ